MTYMKRVGQNLKRTSFFIPIVVLIILLVVLIVGNRFFPNLIFEFVKFLIQLLLIVIFGGILLNEYNRERDRDLELNEFRKNLLANFTRAYFKVKKARRIIDGNIEVRKDNTMEISRKVYETQIKEIIDAQLDFECYWYQLKVSHVSSDKSTNERIKNLTYYMEHNLNEIIDEYKSLNPSIDPLKYDTLKQRDCFYPPIDSLKSTGPLKSTDTQKHDTLTKLDCLITKETFINYFSNHFHECFKLIHSEILHI